MRRAHSADSASGRRFGTSAWLLMAAVLLPGSVAAQTQTQTQTQAQAQVKVPARDQAPDPPGLATGCRVDPLGGRPLFLRGSFNSWGTSAEHRFVWLCTRWQLVTRLQGEQRFKLGDEAWSSDADFGAGPAAGPGAATATAIDNAPAQALRPRGPELQRRFAGTYRFTATMSDDHSQAPTLRIETCPAADAGPPLGQRQLLLRGTPNNWGALEAHAFQFSCDAYYLNVALEGAHEFKIADAAWTPSATIGAGGIGSAVNFKLVFQGEQTLRLAWAGNRPQLSLGPRSFADPRVAPVTDPVARSLRFDSRALTHKSPFGAVPAGSSIDFSVLAEPGLAGLTLVIEKRYLAGNQESLTYETLQRLPMGVVDEGPMRRWQVQHRFAEAAVYGYWFEARVPGAGAETTGFALQNNSEAVYWTREVGSGGRAEVAALPATPAAMGSVRRFRQTVYAADFQVPDWASDAVYYYIFPERFRNGDKSNDPQPGRDKYQNHTVERHPAWIGKPYKPGSGDGSDSVYNNDFFGGDLAGIIDKLDYIRELGANTLYMTPVFRAASNHKYDTADYRHIDPAFGSNADFERLTREATRRGIRVITDASLNHTGSDSIYFDRFGNFKAEGSADGPSLGAFSGGKPNPLSPYASWYRFNPGQTEPDKQYQGWVGVLDLPELDKSSPAWRDFAYRAPDSVTRLWLQRGASGWRMDVAPWVPDDFWREWRTAVKSEKPDALTVAETWFDASKYFLGDMFDSTMNYIFRSAVQAYAAGGSAQAMVGQLEHLREAYPPQAFQALMNLLSTHDQARALYVFGWHDDNPAEKADAPSIVLAKQRLRLALFFQMSYPGAPSVYYGDEVGMTGGDDPYNRGPYPWADEGGQPDALLLADFKRLIKLRHDHPVLRRGSLSAPLHIDEHVLVLARHLSGPSGRQWALTATNNDHKPRTVTVALPAGAPAGSWQDALGGASVKATAQGLQIEVPALFGRVLLAND